MRTIRFLCIQIGVVCSLILITARILDWYNPYMDFSGHVALAQMLLCADMIFLAVTFGRKRGKIKRR